MYDELKANVFPKLPGRIVQMSRLVREIKRPVFVSLHRLLLHLHRHALCDLAWVLFFLHTYKMN